MKETVAEFRGRRHGELTPFRGAFGALAVTVAVVVIAVIALWNAHEKDETLSERMARFDAAVWDAVALHDARTTAATIALRDHDRSALKTLRTLRAHSSTVAGQLYSFRDLAPAAASIREGEAAVARLEASALGVRGEPENARTGELWLQAVQSYQARLMTLRSEGAELHERVRAARVNRSRLVMLLLLVVATALVWTWSLVIRNVRRQFRARREAERLYADVNRKNRLILDASADGIVGIDPAGAVTLLNPAALRMMGLHGGGGPPADQAATAVLQDLCRTVLPALIDGQTMAAREFDLLRPDGSTLPVEVSARALYGDDETIIGGVLALRDVSQRRELDRMKNEFVATISHELRTPLTSIRGALGLIDGGYFGHLSEKGMRMVEIALNNTDRLVRLVNDILDLERLESGAVTVEKTLCNASDIVLSAVESMQPLAAKHGVRLLGDSENLELPADTDRISQVLTNLIGNAIKFSSAGDAVEVSVTRSEKEAIFRVRDHGRGIPPEKLEAIFERFQQVDASDARDKGGTGLGLPICRSIVARHEGRIWAESARGEGSVFTFTLPCEAEPSTAVFEKEPPGVDGRRRVLVCEDDADTREVVSAMLQAAGYAVIPACSGEEALDLAHAQKPDAILLDIILPGISGWETLARLKASAETAAIPVIILSGLAHPVPAAEHVTAWIGKPAAGDALADALDIALAASCRSGRIVIAEDDADLSAVLKTLFERDGVGVSLARSGTEAIDRIEQDLPDLVVLDLGLPGLDGFEVHDWMRRRPRWTDTPVVIYSAADVTALEAARLCHGPTEILVKAKIKPEEFERKALRLLRAALPAIAEERNGSEERIAHR